MLKETFNLLTTSEIMEENKETAKQLAVEKNGRTYQLIVPVDATIGSAYDGCHALLLRIIEIAQEVAKEAAPKEIDAEVLPKEME